jgi:DNA-binding HxlR family transcriptional regulator
MTKTRDSRFDGTPGCAVEATVTLIDGKWKCGILHHLLSGTLRFNQIRKLIPRATQRVLTAQLRELEADGLVERTIYPEVPPRVEYKLTQLGRSLEPVIQALGSWGADHMDLFRPGPDKEQSHHANEAVPALLNR